MRVWLDDERPMPDDFTIHVKTAQEAIDLLKTGNVVEISLDHDLGYEWHGTGYDVACFIEKAAFDGTLKQLRIRVHSQNPVGKRKMLEAIRNAKRFWIKSAECK